LGLSVNGFDFFFFFASRKPENYTLSLHGAMVRLYIYIYIYIYMYVCI